MTALSPSAHPAAVARDVVLPAGAIRAFGQGGNVYVETEAIAHIFPAATKARIHEVSARHVRHTENGAAWTHLDVINDLGRVLHVPWWAAQVTDYIARQLSTGAAT